MMEEGRKKGMDENEKQKIAISRRACEEYVF